MSKKISSKRITMYVFIIAIAILVFLLLDGRVWRTGSMHGQGNNGNNNMEMRSNTK